MRFATLLVAVVVGCGHAEPPQTPAVANTAEPEPAAPAAPAPASPPAVAPAPPAVCRTIDGRTGSQYADQIYCQQVGDACCGSMGQVWICNNARYVDWYFANCEPHH
jgi:hypothetical protein